MASRPYRAEFVRNPPSPRAPESSAAQRSEMEQMIAQASLLPNSAPGLPVSLTGSVSLSPNSTQPVNTDALKNPAKLPLAIHEIKFVASTGATPVSAVAIGTGGGTVPPASASALEATIRLGDKPITKAPVPLNLLGVRRSAAIEVLAKPDGTNIYGLVHQTWRLDAPIILQGGQALDIAIGHRGFYPYAISAYVTISGRFLSGMPKTMQLPYVAPYIPTAFQPTTGTSDALVRISAERDLANELGVPLQVKRFTGRVTTIAAGLSQAWDTVPMVNSQLLTVAMRSSSGVPTVRNDTPFEMVFDAHTASWECPHLLPPGAFWITTLKCARTTTTVVQVQPSIALHGVREERA